MKFSTQDASRETTPAGNHCLRASFPANRFLPIVPCPAFPTPVSYLTHPLSIGPQDKHRCLY